MIIAVAIGPALLNYLRQQDVRGGYVLESERVRDVDHLIFDELDEVPHHSLDVIILAGRSEFQSRPPYERELGVIIPNLS